jgi:hypothetical protein
MLDMHDLQTVPASLPGASPFRRTWRSCPSSTGQHRLPGGYNVLGGVVVPIVDGVAAGTRPRADRQRQLVHDIAAATTPLTAGVEPINLDKRPAVPLGLVRQLPKDLPPADIGDVFGQRRVLDHALDVQVFHDNHLVFADQSCRHLMNKVHPAIGDFLVHLGHFQARLVAVLRSLLFPGHLPLPAGQLLLIFARVLRVANLFSGRERSGMRQAHINADLLLNRRPWFDFHLTSQTDVVAATGRLRDGDGTRGMRDIPRPFHFQLPHLRQFQVGLARIPGKGRPGVLGGLLVMLGFERRVVCPTFPEVDERGLQMPQGLLQRDAAHFIQIADCGVFLPGGQVGTRRGVVHPFLTLIPSIGAQVERMVVHFAHAAKGLRQLLLLFFGGITAKFQPSNLHNSQDRMVTCERLHVVRGSFLCSVNEAVSTAEESEKF